MIWTSRHQPYGVKHMNEKKKKRSLWRFLLKGFLVLVALLVAAYFLVTSDYFLRAVVLPQAGKALGLQLSAQRVGVSLMDSRVILEGVSVGGLLELKHAECRYSLGDILKGDIKASLSVDGADIQLKQAADGSWNIPGLGPSSTSAPVVAASAPAAVPASSGAAAIRLDVGPVEIKNLNVSLELMPQGGVPGLTASVKEFSLSLPSLKTGADAKLNFACVFSVMAGEAARIESGKLAAELAFRLDDQFMPQTAELSVAVDSLRGDASQVDLAGRSLTARLRAVQSAKGFDIKELSLLESANGKEEANIKVDGKIETSPFALGLNVSLNPVSAELLNLAGEMAGGYNFGKGTLNYRGKVSLVGDRLTSEGECSLAQVTLSRPSLELPPIPTFDFSFLHNGTVDFERSHASVGTFRATLLPSAGGKAVKLALVDPAEFSWNGGKFEFTGRPPKVELAVNDLALPFFNMFIPVAAGFKLNSGVLNANVNASIRDEAVALDGEVKVDDLGFSAGDYKLDKVGLEHSFEVGLSGFKELSVKSFSTGVSVGGAPWCKLFVVAAYNLETSKAQAKLIVPFLSVRALDALPEPVKSDPAVRELASRFPDLALALKLEAAADIAQSNATVFSTLAELKRGDKELFSLSQAQAIKLSWAKGFDILPPGVECDVKLTAFPLADANPFIPPSAKLALEGGSASLSAKLKLSERFDNYSFDGSLNLADVALAVDGQRYQGFSLLERLDASYGLDGKLSVRQQRTGVFVQKRSAFKLDSQCDFDLTTMKLSAKLGDLSLNERLLAILPESLRAKIPARQFDLGGKLDVGYDGSGNRFKVVGDLDLKDALFASDQSLSLAAAVRVNAVHDDRVFDISNTTLTMDAGGKRLADLTLSAHGPSRYEEGDINAELSAKTIDVKAIMDYLKSPAQDVPASNQGVAAVPAAGPSSEPSEPDPVDLKGLKAVLNLDLQNVTYGKDLKLALNSKIDLRGNVVTVDPMKLTVNDIPLELSAMVNHGELGGYPYNFKCKVSELKLDAVFKSLAEEGQNTGSDGLVKSFALEASGKGFTVPNLRKNLDAKLDVDAADIVLDKSLIKSNWALWILFCPVTVLDELGSYLPSGSADAISSLTGVRNALKNLQSIKFSSGKVQATAKDGKININTCEFKGEVVKQLSSIGYVDFDKNYSLNTKVDIGVVIPIPIQGTLGKSTTVDYKTLIAALVKDNALKLIDPNTMINLIKNPQTGAADLKEAPQKVLNELLGSLTKDGSTTTTTPATTTTTNSSPQPADLAGQAVNALSGLFDGGTKGVSSSSSSGSTSSQVSDTLGSLFGGGAKSSAAPATVPVQSQGYAAPAVSTPQGSRYQQRQVVPQTQQKAKKKAQPRPLNFGW